MWLFKVIFKFDIIIYMRINIFSKIWQWSNDCYSFKVETR